MRAYTCVRVRVYVPTCVIKNLKYRNDGSTILAINRHGHSPRVPGRSGRSPWGAVRVPGRSWRLSGTSPKSRSRGPVESGRDRREGHRSRKRREGPPEPLPRRSQLREPRRSPEERRRTGAKPVQQEDRLVDDIQHSDTPIIKTLNNAAVIVQRLKLCSTTRIQR